MSCVHLELLGGFSVQVGRKPAPALVSKKARALLAYLAVPPGRFHSREKLTSLLWGETSETQARQSFRQALTTLRRTLGRGAPELLLTEGDAVALNPRAIAVDVSEFESALAGEAPGALARGAALYRGDLLDGFAVDEPEFERWRSLERERLHELALEGLARLLREQLGGDAPESAVQTAQRILALDPLQEAVHRTMMRLLLRQGRRAAALQQYQTCVALLQQELAAEPEPETRELYRDILRAAAGPTAPGVRGVRARAPTPLIGRQGELARLYDALARALDVGGQVVIVSGEAGIGKSRLIREFALAVTEGPGRLAVGHCYESEQTLPLHPWIDVLRGDRPALDPALRDRLGAAGAQLGRVFPELIREQDEPMLAGAGPMLLFDALAALIGDAAAEQPLVLVVEDLHWADALSARFLAFLGRRVERLPVLLVGTMRPEELVDAPALAQGLKELRAEERLDEIALSPLSEVESRALTHALLPARRSAADRDRLAADIWAISEGNPFAIVESVRASLDATAPPGSTNQPRLARNVQDFVGDRLDRLSAVARHVVEVAAVIGRGFPFALVARAAGAGEGVTAEAVEELVRRRVLDATGDDLAFCHDWFRQVACDRLRPTTRIALHAAVADALAQLHRDRLDEVAGELGHHYAEAGDAAAIPHLIRFAEVSGRRYALENASAALEQAMAIVDRLPVPERDHTRLDLAVRQAAVLTLRGRLREVLEILGAHAGHVARVGDAILATEYYVRLTLAHGYFGESKPAHRTAERALREAEHSRDPESIGKASSMLAVTCYAIGNPRRGLACAAQAIALLDRPLSQSHLGAAYFARFLNHAVAGELDAALEAAACCQAVGRRIHDVRLEAHAGYASLVHTLRGDYERAIATARRGLARSPEPYTAGGNTLFLGQAYVERGDAARAIPWLERAVETLAPNRFLLARAWALLAEAYLGAGDLTRAAELARQAVDASESAGAPFHLGIAQRALGRVRRARGDAAHAARYLASALETFQRCEAAFEAARTRLDLAELAAARGARATAREHVTASVAAFQAANAPKRVAQARDLARRAGLDEGSMERDGAR